jgi:hypothetical protein
MNASLEPQPQAPARGFPIALAIGAAAVLVLVAVIWFLSSSSGGEAAVQPLPFGPEEQKYAQRIHFRDFKLSRAENMLGQEVTFIVCTVENAGTGIVRELEVELQFFNLENQAVFSEKRRLLGRYEAPLGGGRFRTVDFNFEKLPPDWNQHAPVVRVTGLVFEP